MQLLWVYNSRILRIKNAKFSGWYCYMNKNIQGDFLLIEISVPLRQKQACSHGVKNGCKF